MNEIRNIKSITSELLSVSFEVRMMSGKIIKREPWVRNFEI